MDNSKESEDCNYEKLDITGITASYKHCHFQQR